ncbi:hypothetical protein HED60_01595 [Planctomycetales bacterium ZRK34]|nr:hypothetical protein HED60_01595 [Planctomycetales bacterium ZRK34]
MKSFMLTVLIAVLLASFAGSVFAEVILMDFGSATYSGTDSPAHLAGVATGTTWNGFATDKASGFVDENNVSVAGLSVDFGVETGAGLRTVNYALGTKSASAGHTSYPVFDNAAQVDHVVRDGSGTLGLAIAVKGLTAGDYAFYLTGFRGDNSGNAARDYNVAWEISTTDVTDFNASAFTTLANTTKSPAGNWIAGNNYLKSNFTLSTGQNLYLYLDSPGFIGVANSLAIVSIPEPASLALLGPALLGLMRRRR